MSSAFAGRPDWRAAPEAERSRLLSGIAEMAGAFEIGAAEIAEFEIKDPTGKEKETARVRRLSYRSAGTGLAEARVEGVEIASEVGATRIGEIAMTGFSFASSLEGLRALAIKPPAEIRAADLRRLAPTIGTVRLSGLAFEPPPRPNRGEPATPIRFALGSAEVTADSPADGVPTNVRLAVDQFTFEIPAETEDAGLKELRAMGYERPNLSWLVAASWNEPGDELLVREVSLSGAGMGAATVRGVLGNVSRDVFNRDSAVAAVALVGATLKNIDITVENGGLFERVLAQEAERQSKRPDDLRLEYGMAAAVGVPAMLGGSGPARAIGQAVARFVAKPGRLSISARVRNPAGLGIADLSSLAEPSALLDQLDVTARAE